MSLRAAECEWKIREGASREGCRLNEMQQSREEKCRKDAE